MPKVSSVFWVNDAIDVRYVYVIIAYTDVRFLLILVQDQEPIITFSVSFQYSINFAKFSPSQYSLASKFLACSLMPNMFYK